MSVMTDENREARARTTQRALAIGSVVLLVVTVLAPAVLATFRAAACHGKARQAIPAPRHFIVKTGRTGKPVIALANQGVALAFGTMHFEMIGEIVQGVAFVGKTFGLHGSGVNSSGWGRRK